MRKINKTLKKCKTTFHILRENDKLKLQNNFLFVDTETKRTKESEEKFHLGWMIYWEKDTNKKTYIYLNNKNIFYDYIFRIMKNKDHLFVFAHNMDFDIKVLGGINKFIQKGFILDSFYINGCRFIIKLKNKNNGKIIEFLDTMNYVPSSLKEIGKSIGLEKTEIDFLTCNDYTLSEYCKNDTEIICLFIQKLLQFLEEYDLSRLKPTVSSLSMNIFRHKFYSKKKNPIFIHGWNDTIEIERLSYRGGISDCFKIGKNIKEPLYKLDINSMYPYVMQINELPTKLLCYRDFNKLKENKLKELFYKYIDQKLIIARCKIYLPKEYAYILVKTKINNQSKSMFLYGTFITTLTTPELNFVIKYGKILEILNIAIYEKNIIFKEFVNFFYTKRMEYDKDGNKTFKLFCKIILNSLYGKFGQTQTSYNISDNKNYDFSSSYIIDVLNDDKYLKMNLGNKSFEVLEEGKNSFDSFVAISSFVTAYARMYLIDMILQAKRKNVYYVDTDCLIVNQEGYDLLMPLINPTELGKLKLEEISMDTTIYRPKYYVFNNKEKCKGIKKTAKRLFEDDSILRIEQEQFTRFKSSLRKSEFEKQTVYKMIKEINKVYDKGVITKNGDIEPYEFNSI